METEEGTKVGIEDGWIEGGREGAPVLVGTELGDAVGAGVGRKVGDSDGNDVGWLVGCADGDAVGDTDGT